LINLYKNNLVYQKASRVRANKFAATQSEADRRWLNASDAGRFRYVLPRFQSPSQVTLEKPNGQCALSEICPGDDHSREVAN